MFEISPNLNRQELCQAATDFLKENEIENASFIARSLYVNAENIDETTLITEHLIIPSKSVIEDYKSMIIRASANEPLSRIKGKSVFYNNEISICEDVLDPRIETEMVIDILKKLYDNRKQNINILDIGTGSGCIAISAAKIYDKSYIKAIDICRKSLIMASRNALTAGVSQRCEFINLDISTLEDIGQFEVILSNPPYIPTAALSYLDNSVIDFDPHIALDGGEDGLDFYRLIAEQTSKLSLNGTIVIFEVGIGQAYYVKELMEQNNFTNFEFYEDHSHIIRCISCRYNDN